MVIDAHLHLWNTERLRYEWLQRPENAAINRTFAVELFGPDRLMFGSDWPVAELGGGYAKVTAELFTLIGQLHPAGRDAILGARAGAGPDAG